MTPRPALTKLAYSLAEVDDLTGLGLKSLRKGCATGQFPHVCRGRQYFMTPAQIEDMLARLTRDAKTAPTTEAQREAAELEAARAHRRRVMRRWSAA